MAASAQRGFAGAGCLPLETSKIMCCSLLLREVVLNNSACALRNQALQGKGSSLSTAPVHET